MAGDVLVQVHVPKCAGTSISSWLRKAASTGALAGFGAFYPDFVFSDDSLWQSGLYDPRLTAISAHNIRRFPPAVHGRPMHYFTILREPLPHVLSIVRYVLQERVAYGVPAEVGNTTRAIAEWLLGRPAGAWFRENTQTNHLALYPWCDATGGRCEPVNYGSWAAADQRAYERERLEVAKGVLQSFMAVGTVERLSESLELLRARTASVGLNLLPVDQLPRENVTRVPAEDAPWNENDASEDLGQRLAEAVRVDAELHAFAGGLLGVAAQNSAVA